MGLVSLAKGTVVTHGCAVLAKLADVPEIRTAAGLSLLGLTSRNGMPRSGFAIAETGLRPTPWHKVIQIQPRRRIHSRIRFQDVVCAMGR